MNRLWVKGLRSVGLVSAGDDPEATVTFWKSKNVDKARNTGELFESRIHSDFTVMADHFFGEGRLTREERISLSSGIGDALNAFREKLEAEAPQLYNRDPDMLAKAVDVAKAISEMHADPQDVSKLIPKAESQRTITGEQMDLSAIENEDLRKSIEEAFAAKDAEIAELSKDPDPDPVADAPEEVQALLKEQSDKMQKLEADLAKERAERRTTEFIPKAQPLEGLLGKADEMGPVLADLANAAPEAYEKLEGALTAASQRAELAELFKTVGTSEGGEDDPNDARDAWVSKQRETRTEPVEVLRAEFWKTHPDMKKESRS